MAGLGAEHAARSMIRDKPRHSLQRLVRLCVDWVSGSRDFHSLHLTLCFAGNSTSGIGKSKAGFIEPPKP